MKRLRVFLLVAVLMLPLSMLATGAALVVEFTNGQTATFLLQDKPMLGMYGTRLYISTESVQTSYERAEVKRFYFTEDPSGVNELSKDVMTYRQTDADHIEISGLSQNDHITVCDMAGRQYGVVSRSNDKAVISLNGHQSGVYLVKVGKSQTIKIIKK